MTTVAEANAAYRAYVDLWDADDAGERRHLAERALADDFTCTYPVAHCDGRAAFLAFLDGFHGRFPHIRVVQTSGIELHHGLLRAAWRIRQADGAVMVDGLDVAELAPDGRLRRVLGFHEPLPPLAS